MGYTVHFAAPVQPDLDEGHLAAVPIQGVYLRRFLARAVERPPSRATEEVITTMRRVVQNLVNSGGWLHASLEKA